MKRALGMLFVHTTAAARPAAEARAGELSVGSSRVTLDE